MLDVDYDLIKEHVYYDETSPTCLRNLKATRNRPAHSVAGCLGSDPKRSAQVKIAGTYYRLMRVVWVINNGNIPKEKYVIPKDNNPHNLKIDNLEVSDKLCSLTDKNSKIKNAYDKVESLSAYQLPESRRFYVYAHKDAEGVIRYIGKGSAKRAYNFGSRGTAWEEIFKDFSEDNIVIIKNELTEDEAFLLEKQLISEHSNTIVNRHRNPKSTKDISYEEASQLLYYDETSPTFLRWKVDRKVKGWKAAKDSVAGHVSKNPLTYSSARINGVAYRAHRVVWVLFHKHIDPNLLVDHIDRNKSNNKISNLRLVTPSVNSRNKVSCKASNEHKNIHKRVDGYVVRFSVNNAASSTFFSVSRFGSFEAALEEAIKFRDKLIEKHLVILD